MQTVLLLVHVFAAVAIVGLILIQQGKGADAGAAFGSGASQTVFGSEGSASFMTRLTGGLAALFFVTSLALAYFSSHNTVEPTSVLDRLEQSGDSAIIEQILQETAPAVPSGIPVPAELPAESLVDK
ncbi:MAG: preprotein translocase subunit SecG [Thiotrichales bacterium]|jgi:preprotein translocase subunit SecG|nr:preprotein translocase subunit SecG [Thiotrichales bacterium]MBT3613461.1 preprotein translocase subunit SecG [Thiotrichales bacterium]MBT3753070.1 preprotein translocase subunit SecG [Thiotrichales bacterium]MBT3837353.1 preprotein translocase subunit SecG [Thiotrichales bacterium]MBT4151623.1 preprotein translocase subunit SecG [Thiotrichales bacterium]